MNRFVRFCCLFLSLLMLIPLSACAQTGSPDSTAAQDPESTAAVSAAEETETAPVTTSRLDFKDNLPADLDFKGETNTIFFRDTIENYSVFGTDNNGDIVTDAIWERNRKVEGRLNINFAYVRSTVGGAGNISSLIRSQAAAGNNDWDMMFVTNNCNVTTGLESIMLDLKTLPYLDFEQPYWWNDAMENVSLLPDRYPYLIGDFMLLSILRIGAFYYNKVIYEDLYGDPDELYNIVLDGKWTLDKFMELGSGAYSDLDGNGQKDETDMGGYVFGKSFGEQMCMMSEGFDIETYVRNADGTVTLTMGNEHVFEVSSKLYEIANGAGCLINSTDIAGARKVFCRGNVLFFPGRFDAVVSEDMRSMTQPYGILPYPKWNEAQKEYISLCHNSSANACVLLTLPQDRYALVGASFEALGAETYRSVSEPFRELALKRKYSCDEMSGKVIDIILGNVRKDLIHELINYTNNIYVVLSKEAPVTDGTFISSYTKLGPAAQKALDKAFADLSK